MENIVRKTLMGLRNRGLVSFIDKNGSLVTGNVEGGYQGSGRYIINCSTHNLRA